VKTAVITGGAGGLGRALGQALQAEGWFTCHLDLPGPELDAIEHTNKQWGIAVDLTDRQAVLKAANQIRKARPSIDLVVHNAGITLIGGFEDQDHAAHRKVFEVNYFAAVTTTDAFLADIRAAKGTHLAISSVAGFTPLIRRTAYAASKHAMEGFFKSLRSEERPFGVHVAIAAPSFVATNLGNPDLQKDGTARPGSATDGVDYMSAEDAADVILKGLAKRRDFIPVGRVATLANLLNRAWPKKYQQIMEKRIGNG